MSVNKNELIRQLEDYWNLPHGARYWGKLDQANDKFIIDDISAFGQIDRLDVPSSLNALEKAGAMADCFWVDRKEINRQRLGEHLGQMVECSLKLGDKYTNSEELRFFAIDLRFLTDEEVELAKNKRFGIAKLIDLEAQKQKSIDKLEESSVRAREKYSNLQAALEKLAIENESLESNRRSLENSLAEVQRRADWFAEVGLLPTHRGEEAPNEAESRPGSARLDASPADTDWGLALERIAAYVAGQGGIYPLGFVQNFIALMRTHDMVVLAGRSGTGKTSFCRLFAEAIEADLTVVPVKPNWVGSDDLLGYLNPVDRTYVRTAFVDALARARRCPEKLHLIVLDEMNIARPEYYLADLLSALENRTQREIMVGTTGGKRNTNDGPEKIAALDKLLRALESKSGGTPPSLAELRARHAPALAAALGCSVSALDATLAFMTLDAPKSNLSSDDNIVIPDNVRIIGTINIDETTNFFSPKVLDRVFLVRLDDPLGVPDDERCYGSGPAFPMSARCFGERAPYPKYDTNSDVVIQLSELTDLMRNLGFDISLRVFRQAMNYAEKLAGFAQNESDEAAFVNVIRSKILPRMVFDADEVPSNEKYRSKSLVLRKLTEIIEKNTSNQTLIKECRELCRQSENGDHQVNFWVL